MKGMQFLGLLKDMRGQALTQYVPLRPQSLTPVEGVPPLEELQRYNACGAAADEDRAPGGGAAGDLSSLVAALPSGGSAPRTTFVKGDLVRIVKGEL